MDDRLVPSGGTVRFRRDAELPGKLGECDEGRRLKRAQQQASCASLPTSICVGRSCGR